LRGSLHHGPDITVQHGKCRGYGMVAGQPIKKGEKLVNVPRNLWMTSLTARTSPVCGQMVKEYGLDSWKVWVTLSDMLIYHMLNHILKC
jgi:hypothetical protein